MDIVKHLADSSGYFRQCVFPLGARTFTKIMYQIEQFPECKGVMLLLGDAMGRGDYLRVADLIEFEIYPKIKDKCPEATL